MSKNKERIVKVLEEASEQLDIAYNYIKDRSLKNSSVPCDSLEFDAKNLIPNQKSNENALIKRVEHLEEENLLYSNQINDLKRQNEQLQHELDRLQFQLDTNETDDSFEVEQLKSLVNKLRHDLDRTKYYNDTIITISNIINQCLINLESLANVHCAPIQEFNDILKLLDDISKHIVESYHKLDAIENSYNLASNNEAVSNYCAGNIFKLIDDVVSFLNCLDGWIQVCRTKILKFTWEKDICSNDNSSNFNSIRKVQNDSKDFINHEVLKNEIEQLKIKHSQYFEKDIILNEEIAAKNLEIEHLQSICSRLEVSVSEKEQNFDQMQKKCNELRQQIDNMVGVESKQQNELNRLRNYLIDVEGRYTKEIITLQNEKALVSNNLDLLRKELSHQKEIALETRNSKNNHFDAICNQLNILTTERDEAVRKVKDLTSQCSQFVLTVNLLHDNIKTIQGEHELQIEVADQRLCKITDESINKQRLIDELNTRLSSKQKTLHSYEVDNLNLKETNLKLTTKIDQLKNQLNVLNSDYQRDRDPTESTSNVNPFFQKFMPLEQKVSNSNQLDKTLLRNILLGYFNSPYNRRSDIIRLLGNLIGLTNEEIHEIGDGSYKFRNSVSNQLTKDYNDQSFVSLFVDFIENSSSNGVHPFKN